MSLCITCLFVVAVVVLSILLLQQQHAKLSQNKLLKRLVMLHRQLWGEPEAVPKSITVRKTKLPRKYVGRYTYDPNSGKGLIEVSNSVKDQDYINWIITHEMIHSVVGKNHGGRFHQLADMVGLPRRYQD